MMLHGKHIANATVKPSKFDTAAYLPVQPTDLTTVEYVLAQALAVDPASAPYLEIIGKQIRVKALAVSSVTVNTSASTLAAFVAANYTGGEFQEGDTVILANATGGSQVWMHNGGNAATAADFTRIESPVNETDPTVPAHVKAITSAQINLWNTAYSWGDHALAGYLISIPPHTHDVSAITGGTAGQLIRRGGTGAEWWTPNYLTSLPLHGHAISEVSGLQAALDGKAATSHTHTRSQITDFAHGHAISEVLGLQAALDGKAAVAHAHAITDLTGGANGQIIRKNPTTGTVEWVNPDFFGGGSNWATDGTDVWRATGFVGIGTNDPLYHLHIEANRNNWTAYLRNTHANSQGLYVESGFNDGSFLSLIAREGLTAREILKLTGRGISTHHAFNQTSPTMQDAHLWMVNNRRVLAVRSDGAAEEFQIGCDIYSFEQMYANHLQVAGTIEAMSGVRIGSYDTGALGLAQEGLLAYDVASQRLRVWTGTAWDTLLTGSA